eukprot:CAMPEP_0196744508 /NCGR_PEP_ID=MMETSP1091-20130531/57872_1 /TAXON_ID=302021 /ORGANISM="Rhodomonas sp., Strain CCMP768" /LENGTH=283 /DNA_ID=CAMNT_0042091071 /DNA_START=57 /DNA_END=908 /DNA_ORIENTATION=+
MSRNLSSTLVGRTLYRSLMKEIRALNADGAPCMLIERFDPKQRGWRWFPGGRLRSLPTQRDVLFSILPPGVQNSILGKANAADTLDEEVLMQHPWLPREEECKEGVTGVQLRSLVRGVFRARADAEGEERHAHEEDAFVALREIGKQRYRQACSSTNFINGLKVRATAIYQPADSARPDNNHVFCYRVTIKNESDRPMRLVGRHWYVIDGNGKVTGSAPEGSEHAIQSGTPDLQPGQGFEYYSGVDITTAEGTMCGSFHMVTTDDGSSFDAIVNPFALRANPE